MRNKPDKVTEIVTEIVVWIVAIAMIAGFMMWLRNRNTETETETTIRKETVTVTDCHNGNQYCVVTVEDHNGNLWDYYSDKPEIKGTCVVITWNGNNEIIDAE